HGPQPRVHRAVVADVVTPVGQRRRIERRQPDSVYAEGRQGTHARPQPRQVPYAVAVRVGEAARIYLVDDRVFPPHVPAVAHVYPSSLMYRPRAQAYGAGLIAWRPGGAGIS